MFHKIYLQNLAILTLTSSASFAQKFDSLSSTLTDLGLNSLRNLTERLANDTSGLAFLERLSNRSCTVLGPDDDAFSQDPSLSTLTTDGLVHLLEYHVLQGSFPNSTSSVNFLSAESPDHTIAHSLLNDNNYVRLGGPSQAVAWSKTSGAISFLDQPNNANVSVIKCLPVNGTSIDVCQITGVLAIPSDMSTVISSYNNTQSLTGLLNNTSVLTANGTNVTLSQIIDQLNGSTIFVPDDAAFAARENMMPTLENNSSSKLEILLQNHLLNGTTLYSPEIYDGLNLTTAAGEPIIFTANSSGTFVTVGTTTAQIIYKDGLASNGAVYIINGLFLDLDTNPDAASSAYASATSVAAQETVQTGVVAAATTSSSPGSTSHSTTNGAEALPVVARSSMVALTTVFTFVVFGAYLV